jgi:hypothetical protein
MIEGIMFHECCCVVALLITADGTKIPVGVWEGDTENATVVKHLLADLVERGLRFEAGLLDVIDGVVGELEARGLLRQLEADDATKTNWADPVWALTAFGGAVADRMRLVADEPSGPG